MEFGGHGTRNEYVLLPNFTTSSNSTLELPVVAFFKRLGGVVNDTTFTTCHKKLGGVMY